MKISRISLLFSVFVMALSLVSCKKDKEENKDPFDKLYGFWEHVRLGSYDFKTCLLIEEDNSDARNIYFLEDGRGYFDDSAWNYFTWKSDDLKNHIVFEGYSFKLKVLSDNEILLLEDPEYSTNYYDLENETFGVHLRKIVN